MKIFVYGSLKRGSFNSDILKGLNANYIDDVSTLERYPLYLLNDPFPYLQNNKGVGLNVIGEMYELSDQFKSELDAFEGVGYLYKRGKIDVVDSKGCQHICSCYFANDEIIIDEYINLLEEF
jgi:gamma-glutamylcyclotransferase (GGCT)/AIG2-like uncharacterized protein YtfP